MRCFAGCCVGCFATRFGGIDGIASPLLVSDLDYGDAFALRYGPAVFLPGNGLSGDGDGGGL